MLGVQVSGDAGNATILKPDGSLYTPNPISNGVSYGGKVAWLTDYDYFIEATGGYIADILYEAPKTYKSLSVADGTNDRLDAFVLDTANSIQVVEGTPSANPQLPNIALNQLLLNFAIVKAGSTEPDLNVDEIYQENTEWTTASSNSGRINPAATASPITGAKDIEATAPLNTDWITFHRSTPVYAAALNDVLVFTIKPKTGTGIRKLRMSFTLSGTKVGKYVTLKNGSFGYDISSLTAQIIIIPLTSFGLATSQSVDGLKIENQTAGYGWRMDDISLQKTNVIGTTVIREFPNNTSALLGGLKEGSYYSTPLNDDDVAVLNIVRQAPEEPIDFWESTIEITYPNTRVEFDYKNASNLTIVFGDGGFTTIKDTTKLTSLHTYKIPGIYTVKIWGSFDGSPDSGFNQTGLGGGDTPFQQLMTATNQIKGITGMTSASQLFYNSTNLTSIPAGLFNNCAIISSFQMCFGRSGITTIPTGLFDVCTLATDFSSCFWQSQLTAIPAGLFDNCPNVITFESCFEQIQITTIPTGLFDNCISVEIFDLTFGHNASLTAIPSGLFDNCVAVVSFGQTFNGCSSLTSIPSDIFDNCILADRFFYCFASLTAFTGAVPELWVTFPSASDHGSCFHFTTGASNYSDIPSDWK